MNTLSKITFKSLVLLTAAMTLFSFTAGFGGDSFVIYLNNKTVLKQHVSQNTSVQTIVLNRNSNDQLDIFYSECGKIGNKRTISLRDQQNRVVKQWQYPDVTTEKNNNMSCKVNDIVASQKSVAANDLHLYYSSKEVSNGRLLARIVFAEQNRKTLP